MPPILTYLRIFWQRGWIVLLTTILAAASAFVFSSLQTPLYKSTVNVLVQPARNDFGLSQSAKLLLNSYVAYLNTNTQAANVIAALQLDTSPDALRSGIRMESEIDKFLIKIEMISSNGESANQIAGQFAKILVDWRNAENQYQRNEDRVTAQMLDQPRYALHRPQKMLNTIAGAALGALLGGAILFGLEYWASSLIRTPSDIERYLELSVLGNIPTPKEA